MVVAFQIRRPWPERSDFRNAPEGTRWSIRLHHEHFDDEQHPGICCGCGQPTDSKSQWFPWWKPSSYSSFWLLAGRDFYWPPMITIWHNEPGGHDALSTCSIRRLNQKTGKWYITRSWKWHFWHYHIQISSFQHLRRYLLTRCEVCGGKSRKGHVVNFSNSWSNPKTHFWQGERGLRHGDCNGSHP